MSEVERNFRITGWHVLIGLALFFGGVIAANAWMAYQAVATFDGVERADAYRRGVDYNAVIDAARAQAALGWQVEVVTEIDGVTPAVGLDVAVRDRDGRPLDGLNIEALLWRPVTGSEDVAFTLSGNGGGHYRGRAAVPEHGQWEVRVTLKGADGAVFNHRQRIVIKAPA